MRSLATSLAHDDLDTATLAIDCLGRIGNAANAAVPVLEELRAGEPALRESLEQALRQIRAAEPR